MTAGGERAGSLVISDIKCLPVISGGGKGFHCAFSVKFSQACNYSLHVWEYGLM